MPLLAPSHPSLTQLRTFSCTARTLAKSTKQRLKFEHSAVPPYPYGPSQIYKQSNFGLYGTQKIRFGNMVSERNEIKTRRWWRPNVQLKRLWSDSLQKFIRVRITARVLRTVDKVGGLDEYLLGDKAGRIKELGMGGWKLRWRLLQTDKVKERYRRQRQEFGLLPTAQSISAVQDFSRGITDAQIAEEIRQFDEDLELSDVEIGEEAQGQLSEEEYPEPGFMEEQPVRGSIER